MEWHSIELDSVTHLQNLTIPCEKSMIDSFASARMNVFWSI